jgi:hypothetical protein
MISSRRQQTERRGPRQRTYRDTGRSSCGSRRLLYGGQGVVDFAIWAGHRVAEYKIEVRVTDDL